MEIVTKEMFENFKNELNGQLNELKNSVENKQTKKIMKNKELKEYLGVSYSTLDKMRANNIIPYKKIMGNYYYNIEEINKSFKHNN
ncbi:MAG: helix-turn-helix domain-containing protein [Bacteroidetes bacterium]|nr:helix-turn-helix domain-containing protein [Bacteroidota bacterium]